MAKKTFQDKLIEEKAQQLSFDDIIHNITICESNILEAQAEKELNRQILRQKMKDDTEHVVRGTKVVDGIELTQTTLDINGYNVSESQIIKTTFNKNIVLDTSKYVKQMEETSRADIVAYSDEYLDGLSATEIREVMLQNHDRSLGHVQTIINSFDTATTSTVYDRLDLSYSKQGKK